MEPKVTVQEWDQRWEFFTRAMEERLDEYSQYCAWFNNEFDTSVVVPGDDDQVEGATVSAINMVNRITRAWTAWVYTDQPRMVARPEEGFMADDRNGSDLANVLTAIGNDISIKTDLYYEGERLVQDSGMSPFFVMKIGYDASIDLDVDRLKKERDKAREENAFMKAGREVEVQEDEYHSAHREIHLQELENIEKGIEQMPEDVVEQIKAHEEEHREFEEKLGDDRKRWENVRAQRVFLRRKDPRRVAFDLFSPSLRALRWAGEEFLIAAEELIRHKRFTINKSTVPGYDPDKPPKEWKGKADSEEIQSKWHEDLDISDDGTPRFIAREMVDTENDQVVCYIVGAEEPFSVKKYDLGKYLGGVPYEIDYIIPDPTLIIGVSPVKAWEHQQRDLIDANTVVAAVGRQQAPGRVFNKDKVDEQEIVALQTKVVGRDVGLKHMEAGEKVGDVLNELPTTRLTSELLAWRNEAKTGCEEGSLMGQPRLGGGEHTRTATASAILAQSSDRPTKQAAIKIDQFFRRVFRKSTRLAKAFYTLNTVVGIAGQKAAKVWREFRMSEILDDRGIDIVVSSMRRANTEIEMQLMGDLLSVLLRNPAYVASPTLQIAANRLMDYLFSLYGAPIDLSDISEMIQKSPDQFSVQGGAQSPGPTAGPGNVSGLNDLLQGGANLTGGGRTR